MRPSLAAFLILILHSVVSAQQRYLVSPNNEVYPLSTGERAASKIEHLLSHQSEARNGCENPFIFGYSPENYPSPIGGYVMTHKDVLAMWFIAPATGSIDTLYWTAMRYGNYDSVVAIRFDESMIGPGTGPGYDFPPPCYPWGYYANLSDADNAISPFLNIATDTTWISTVPGPRRSFPIMGRELWGLGGFPTRSFTDRINVLDLSALSYTPHVTAGQVFWISMRNTANHPIDYSNEHYFLAPAVDETGGAPVPARNWKFHEHSSYYYCNNLDTIVNGMDTTFKPLPGWYVKGKQISSGGDLVSDPNGAYAFNWWFSMTVESDIPPIIFSTGRLHHTTGSGPFPVSTTIQDCNPMNPIQAGVSSAVTRYSINGSAWDSVAMSNSSADVWSGIIPPAPLGATVRYQIRATDINEHATETGLSSFRVVPKFTLYYSLDTVTTGGWREIAQPANLITRWFTRLEIPPIDSTDNTTAGPFDLGGIFRFFDQTVRYAWIGVDGAMHLSSSPTDTIDIGFFSYGQIIPEWRIPKNLLAPLNQDYHATPAIFSGRGHGGVYAKIDGSQFIVEWYQLDNITTPDDTSVTFEAILDRTDNSIMFLYKDTGISGVDSTGLIGLQADTSADHYFFCQERGYPSEWRPRTGMGLRFSTNFQVPAMGGWNLVSAPGSLSDPRKSVVFPLAVSPAFSYDGSYIFGETIQRGRGYWIRYPDGINLVPVSGTEIVSDSIPVRTGWNMVGSISIPILVTNIISVPPALETSQLFEFDGASYIPSDTIIPGRGYWIRSVSPGILFLSNCAETTGKGRITIVATTELPPSPPSGDDNPHSVPGKPFQFNLAQNFPNPFNPETELRFEIPTRSFVTLEVFDVLGRLVATLVREEKEPGEYRITFDASTLSSGIYVCQLIAGGFSETRKMIMVR